VWQGELLEITYISPNREYRVPGKRKPCQGFTPAARLRMLRTVASIEWASLRKSVFITLTYPDEFIGLSMQERNKHRYLFMRDMENYLERKLGALWRVEWMPRLSGKNIGTMMCHVHMIVFNCPFYPKENVLSGWQRALRVEQWVDTSIKLIDSGEKAARYVTKYCGKKVEPGVLGNSSFLNSPGRHWGMTRKELIPFAWRVHVPFLDDRSIALAENLAACTFKFFTRGTNIGFSIFGKNAKKIGEEIFQRDVDKNG